MERCGWIGLNWEVGVLRADFLPKNALSGTIVPSLMLKIDKK